MTLSDNRVAGDTLVTSHATAAFADKNVGSGKTVSVGGIALTGADAANYTANTTATASANITAKGLTVSGITANNKVYDGTTTATLNLATAALAGAAGGDDVTLNTNGAAGAFASKTVGTAKPVTISSEQMMMGGSPPNVNQHMVRGVLLNSSVVAVALTESSNFPTRRSATVVTKPKMFIRAV